MQKLRTNGTLLMIIFGAYLIFIVAPNIVKANYIDKNVDKPGKVFRNAHNFVEISDITTSLNDDDIKPLITYRSINHQKAISDDKDEAEDIRIYQVQLNAISGDGDDVLLISTPFEKICRENSTFPAWKIDKNVRKFLVKINHAKRLEGKVLYLCYFDESKGEFRHLGNESRFSINDG